MAAERNALRESVFPKLERLCAQRKAHFQAVDLRWGVSEEASLDQQALAICLEEIARCQQRTPRPNFVLLLGERYGWRPLPPRIPSAEMEAIKSRLEPDDEELIGAWYREDRNALPPVYVLRPREGQATDEEVWDPIEERLRRALARAAKAARLGPRAGRKYWASVTEQEAQAGILEVPGARDHVHCFFRTIVDGPDGDRGSGLRDSGKDKTNLTALKDRLRKFLGNERVHEYASRWEGGAPSADYLGALCADVYAALSGEIEAELETAEHTDSIVDERAAHERFGGERRRYFVGRRRPLAAIASYIAGESNTPLAVVGASGVGKTAFVAEAAAVAARTHPDATVIVRFVGATSRAAVPQTLLQDLLAELRRARGAEEADVPSAYRDLVDVIREELTQERARRVLLFIDALDQLRSDDEIDLAWLPSELPSGVRVAVSAVDGPIAELLERRLPAKAVVAIEPMPEAEAGELLDVWLADAGRTLQGHQRREVLRSFAVHGLPLHLRLAFEESRRWPSFAPPDATTLEDSIPGLIRGLLARLSRGENHGRLPSTSLALLAAARNGLSEDELIDLVSEDELAMRDFQERSPRSPAVARIPDVVWSRLHSDLEPYLNEHWGDGRMLLGFYHRQLTEVIEREFLEGEEGRHRHGTLAAYFGRQPLQLTGPRGAVGNLRKLSELPFQQTHAGLWDDLFATLTDFDFLERKVSDVDVEEHAGEDGRIVRTYPGVLLLQEDFELALRHWPEDEG